MSRVYSSGLSITPRTRIRRRRQLPVGGEVLVKKGDSVEMDTVVARADLPGAFHPIPVAAKLGILPSEIRETMVVSEGDIVSEGQALAESSALFGVLRRSVNSPLNGVVESISPATGQVMLRGMPTPLELLAYVSGVVGDTDGGRFVDIDSEVSLVQGIFGVGGETQGRLRRISEQPGGRLDASDVLPSDKDTVLFTGGQVTGEALVAMENLGVRGVVAASVSGIALLSWTGKHLNPASTGPEDAALTVVLTEGFGELAMMNNTFDILSSLDGKRVSLSGVTQIRAGVIRPEVVASPVTDTVQRSGDPGQTVECGTPVRVVRGALFGKTGRVEVVPSDLVTIATGARTLVYDVLLDDGHRHRVPRQNVERIGGEVHD